MFDGSEWTVCALIEGPDVLGSCGFVTTELDGPTSASFPKSTMIVP